MKIKQALLTSAAIAALPLGTADAADHWAGFYVGANVGGIWGQSVQTVDRDTDPSLLRIPANTSGPSGVIGGLQAGYNWQLSNIVLGIEGDYDLASAQKTGVTAPFDTHNTGLSDLATLRGRIGWAFDRLLPYATGGVAVARLTDELVDTSVPLGSVSRGNSATGWTAGGGLEYAFDRHWSAKAEYLYDKFPDKTVALVGGAGYLFQFTFKDSEQLARVGINYKF